MKYKTLIDLDPYSFWFLAFLNEIERCGQRLQKMDMIRGRDYFTDGWTPESYAHATTYWRPPEV